VPWPSSFQKLPKLLDPYDLKARLLPGLLVIAPVIFFIGLIFGPKNVTVTTLLSIIGACGGPYVLATVVRTRGQMAQVRLYKKWGAQPTTILLRHRDIRLPPQTKERYRELAAYKLGMKMPGPAEEASNPADADHAYAALADALRPLTNDNNKFPFVFKELVSYGFNRNAYGVRWIGVLVCVLTSIGTLLHATGIGDFRDPSLFLTTIHLPHAITLFLCAALLLLWMLHFGQATVEHAAYSYGLRLWEALEKIPRKPAKKDTSG
jgi:hypothetical protein